eukprot:1611086-Pyramimonas_sp.AAC.1
MRRCPAENQTVRARGDGDAASTSTVRAHKEKTEAADARAFWPHQAHAAPLVARPRLRPSCAASWRPHGPNR